MKSSRPSLSRIEAGRVKCVCSPAWMLLVGVTACSGAPASEHAASVPQASSPSPSSAGRPPAGGTPARGVQTSATGTSGAGPSQTPVTAGHDAAGTQSVAMAGQSGDAASAMAGADADGAEDAAPSTGQAMAGDAAAGASGSAGAGLSSTGRAGAGGSAPVVVDMSHYQERGKYAVERLDNQGPGTLVGATDAQYPQSPHQDPSAFTVYLPKDAREGETFPLITWGNGTYVNPTYYDELITHIVSHGFVVVGANDSQVGSGEAMLKAVDWAAAQNTDSSSPLHGLIDSDHVGATGQSQGGSGTCNAGLDARIAAIAPLSGVPLDGGANFTMNLKIPAFFVNSAGEDASSTMVKDIYERVSSPAVYGVTATGEHNSYGDIADDPMAIIGGPADDARESRAGITAWFDWQLKGKSELRTLFVGADCGFCKGSTWKTIISKGL